MGKIKCEWEYKRVWYGKAKWVRCENKPKFILITKPIEHSLGSKKELCQKHLQEYIKSYKLNDRNYKVIEIK